MRFPFTPPFSISCDRPLALGALLAMVFSGLYAPRADAAAARRFHIDAQAGDDSKDGLSPETAWKSAAGLAGRVLGPGERVLFRAGAVHAAPVSLAARGQAGRPVVIGR